VPVDEPETSLVKGHNLQRLPTRWRFRLRPMVSAKFFSRTAKLA
jgi:hypothetical protein